ncbi:hypothetical protein [Beijerinckia indica]|nr:hypothetical protein [Beijerinckia indica]
MRTSRGLSPEGTGFSSGKTPACVDYGLYGLFMRMRRVTPRE